jgi:hypothetical protein
MPNLDLATDTAKSLAMLREDIELKIHLASTDASGLWKALKPQWKTIEQNFRLLVSLHSAIMDWYAPDAFDEAALQIHLGLMDAKTWVSPIMEELGRDPGFIPASDESGPHPLVAGVRQIELETC